MHHCSKALRIHQPEKFQVMHENTYDNEPPVGTWW